MGVFNNMSRRRRYKIVNAATADMESDGGQVRLGYVSKVDAQGISGYLHNIQVSALINNYDGGDTTPGIMFYLTTSTTWSDAKIITAAAMPIAGKVNLSAKRWIKENQEVANGNIGTVHLWAELTDITITDDIEMRYVAETWGSFVLFTEV